MSHQNFIGYATLEKLADVMNVFLPVYATATQTPGQPGQYGMIVCRAEIVVEQPDGQGDVHYCLIPIGRYTMFDGAPNFDPNKAPIVERQVKWFALIKSWLEDIYGLTIREAQIAKPADLRLLEGCFEGMAVSQARDEEPAVELAS